MNTPKIRFKGYTDAWEQRKLGDFGEATGGTSIESEFSEDGIYKVINIGSYSEDSTYRDQGIRAIDSEKTKNRVLNAGDLTMILNDKTASGNIIGRALLIEESGVYVYNQRTERIEIYKDKYDAAYIYEMLNAPEIRDKIIKQSQGNTQIYVNWSAISQTEYLVPKFEEQCRIGEFLQKLGTLITLHQRKCDSLNAVKKYMLQKMFPKQGESVPEIRFKGFTGAWEQRKIGDIARNTYGGGTPKTSVEEYWNGNIPWIQSSNLKENELFSVDIQKRITETGLHKSATQLVPGNSIAVVSHVGVGKLVFMPMEYTTSQDFISLSDLKTEPKFTCYALHRRLQQDLHIVQGSAIKGITKDDLLIKEINVPRFEEQEKIGSYFYSLDNLIALHQRKCDNLKELKKFMLQNMFP